MVNLFEVTDTKPLWYIETLKRHKGKTTNTCVNIEENGYETKEEAEEKIKEYYKEQQEDNNFLMDRYQQRLEEFIMDMNTEDREPREPMLYNYKYKATQYILTARGYEEPAHNTPQ